MIEERDALPVEKKKYFTAEYTYSSLTNSKPAFLCFFCMGDWPPDYLSACTKYLSNYSKDYVPFNIYIGSASMLPPAWIRKDLVNDKSAGIISRLSQAY